MFTKYKLVIKNAIFWLIYGLVVSLLPVIRLIPFIVGILFNVVSTASVCYLGTQVSNIPKWKHWRNCTIYCISLSIGCLLGNLVRGYTPWAT